MRIELRARPHPNVTLSRSARNSMSIRKLCEFELRDRRVTRLQEEIFRSSSYALMNKNERKLNS